VLDARVYRTAFLPALVALFVAAFALADRPSPAPSPLPADAFSGKRAYGNEVAPEPESLLGMARDFPSRAPGSPGDNGLADRVARVFAAPDDLGRRSAFEVQRTTTRAHTPDGTADIVTVTGTRPGLSSRRIVVLAHRDARGRPGLAELSATATLLELARVFKTRELNKTLVLVSTSGAQTGFAGARAWAEANKGTPVDAVIVLGDVGGEQVHKPLVVSWPDGSGGVPLGLERTVQAAVRAETKNDPGAPRAVVQWVRRAFGVTVSEQGPIAAAGLPATLISQSGERGPDPGEPVVDSYVERYGRAVLRAVTAIDAAGPRAGRAFSGAPHGIVTMRNVLPDWAVRLVIATLLLPALLVALDAFFRARRRRVPVTHAFRRLAVAAVPVVVAWLILRLFGAVGLLPATDGPVLPDVYPADASALVAIAAAAVFAAVAWYVARRALARPCTPDGYAIATGLSICVLATLVWVPNPYAAALLLPAAHLWPWAAGGRRLPTGAAAALAGLAVPLVALAFLSLALGLAPPDLAWASVLAVAGGHGLWSALVLAVFAAAFALLVRVLIARRGDAAARTDEAIKTRGPKSYAGPGSLGGTESALRR
jgi:hypothetical protein